jgi:hypothetical protein
VSAAQWRILIEAERMPRYGFDGVVSKGPRAKSIKALESAGLLRFAGYGVECDGDGYSLQPERERPIYEITDAGRAALSAPSPGTEAKGATT